jgi:CubicO group peptidase (beta-lactamase class C family)
MLFVKTEDYSDPNADIWIYSAAASPLPKPADYSGPDGYFEYLQTVQPEGAHGDAFHYKTINSDALGWIVSRVSGMEVTELLSERIPRPRGFRPRGGRLTRMSRWISNTFSETP